MDAPSAGGLRHPDDRCLQGHVHGALYEEGWDATLGYLALALDPDGPAVEVHLFESCDLPEYW